jgi:hypothetical protein
VRSSKVAALCLLVLSAASMPASATEEDSKTFFAQGRQLRAAGNCPDAIVAFRRALEAFPQGLGALRNIAECEEQLGQFASARNDWWSLRRAVLQSNELRYESWEKDAEQGYARLATKVAKITIRIHGADPAQTQITLDGKPLDPRLLGVELERDLGPHTVQASYGGAAPVVEKRTLVAGSSEVVTLEIPTSTPQKISPGPITAPPPPPDPIKPKLRTAGLISLTVGGIGMIGTATAIIVRQGALAEIDKTCHLHSSCPESLRDATNRGQTASTLANVFGSLAVVGVGAGVALWLVGSSAPSPSMPAHKTTAELGLTPLPGGGAAQIGVTF